MNDGAQNWGKQGLLCDKAMVVQELCDDMSQLFELVQLGIIA